MAMHPEFATPESFSLYLQRIELTIYGIQSMMSTLLIVGGAAWCNSPSNVGLNTEPKGESGSRVFDHPPEKQIKSHIVPASKLRRLRAKAFASGFTIQPRRDASAPLPRRHPQALYRQVMSLRS